MTVCSLVPKIKFPNLQLLPRREERIEPIFKGEIRSIKIQTVNSCQTDCRNAGHQDQDNNK